MGTTFSATFHNIQWEGSMTGKQRVATSAFSQHHHEKMGFVLFQLPPAILFWTLCLSRQFACFIPYNFTRMPVLPHTGCTRNAPAAPQTQSLHASRCKSFVHALRILYQCTCDMSVPVWWRHLQPDITSVTNQHRALDYEQQCGARVWAQLIGAHSCSPN